MNENQRYAAVRAQIAQLLDDARNDKSPATALLRAQLTAEMYTRNEQAHERWQSAMHDLLTTIERRIAEIRRVAP